MPRDHEEDPGGEQATIYFRPHIKDALDRRAEQMDRSRSWLVNFAVAQMLGIPMKVDE
jgi:predicted transcriptional regulator